MLACWISFRNIKIFKNIDYNMWFSPRGISLCIVCGKAGAFVAESRHCLKVAFLVLVGCFVWHREFTTVCTAQLFYIKTQRGSFPHVDIASFFVPVASFQGLPILDFISLFCKLNLWKYVPLFLELCQTAHLFHKLLLRIAILKQITASIRKVSKE